MSTLFSPGVYVFEVAPVARPITGVGTSTAAFLGLSGVAANAMPAHPAGPLIFSDGTITYTQSPAGGGPPQVALAGNNAAGTALTWPTIPGDATITLPAGSGKAYPVAKRQSDTVLLLSADSGKNPGANLPAGTNYSLAVTRYYPQADAGKPYLVTNWQEFMQKFGDFAAPTAAANGTPATSGNVYLAHAVYGFFYNGGTRCYVVRVADLGSNTLDAALLQLGAIDEVALVAAPLAPTTGNNDVSTVQNKLLGHCNLQQDRFAILDSVDNGDGFDVTALTVPGDVNGYGALYFPWLVVANPLKKVATDPDTVHVPPCGHIAGIYARSDANRGVFKAPANEQVLGIQGLAYGVTRNQQEGLNPQGVNCIRNFYGTPIVWGARTVASGNPNADPAYRYVNVRRFMNFLRESIIQGVNWAVFEPNSPALWKRIIRSVSDFLLGQWRDGALFGDTPEQAFFVRCDASTNPSDVRDQGQVVTEIGVAIVKPAEFVVFRIQQQTGG